MTPERPVVESAARAAAGSGAPAGPAPPAPETNAPMLDIHPLRHAATGWREFIVHIATIAVGLLIAIGLEHLVTYLHHRAELSNSRAELSVDVASNQKQLEANREWLGALAAQLAADMRLLANPRPPSGSALSYPAQPRWPLDGAWQAAKQTGSIALMPHDELEGFAYLDDTVQAVKTALPPLVQQLLRADVIKRRSGDGPLPARDVEALIAVTSEAQAQLEYSLALLNYEDFGLKRVRR